jgi:hypothetical protein
MTRYLPITDQAGTVLGAWFIGPISPMASLAQAVVRQGEGRHQRLLLRRRRASGAQLGTAVLHPTLQGKSLVDLKDAKSARRSSGRCWSRSGELAYWQGLDGQPAGEQMAVFTTYGP